MDRTASRFLIVTSDTGGGHNSAASALAAGFACVQPDPQRSVAIVRPIDEGHVLSRWLGQLYNLLLRHHQPSVKYYYRLLDHWRPNESQYLFRLSLPYFQQVFEKHRPQVVISVHPMMQHVLAWLLRHLNLAQSVPLFTVVTDPCYRSWVGWACPDVQRYFVATEGARQQLLDHGVAAEKIQLAGIPIHPKFQPATPAERLAARTSLGLDAAAFTVFFNAGWVGGGNIPGIFERFLTEATSTANQQIIFLAGRNARLQRWAERLAGQTQVKIVVLGYVTDMQIPMHAADVMVSKLGGLTTFEALAVQLPIIIDGTTSPMPQEAETVRLLVEHDAGIMLHKAEDLGKVISALQGEPHKLAALRRAAAQLARPGATEAIVASILNLAATHPSAGFIS